jgi:hypothetical protein
VRNRDFWEKLVKGGENYRITRFVILRFVGLIYAVAFLVAANQIVPLIGQHGLTPASQYLPLLQAHFGSGTAAMMHVPTLFWFGISDGALVLFSWFGFAISLVVIAGYANAIILAFLWTIYMSIVHIGQIWYGYGWETQLLETGFLAIFPLSIVRRASFSATPAAPARHLALPMAWFSHHAGLWTDQITWR